MGNETSILKKCNLAGKPKYSTLEWSLYDATHENQSFSVFVFNENNYCYDFTKWKHVRHPNLVKFYEAGLYKNKKYILTESVIPVRQILDKFHKFSKLSGLNNIGEALSFLHQICNISVNNLSIDSIFISKNDPKELWKLGSLYWCSGLNTENLDFIKSLISFHHHNNSMNTLPPEDRDSKTRSIITSSKDIQRRDSYSFVNLIEELFYDAECPPKLSDILLASENEITNHNFMAKALIENFNLSPADQRPSVRVILSDQLFQNCPFVQMRKFFTNFNTYNDEEKCNFLKVLINNLCQFSDQSLVVNIFTMIVSSRFILSNKIIYNQVMPYFLIPSKNCNTKPNTKPNVQMSEQKPTENIYVLTNGETKTISPFIEFKIFQENILPHIMKLYFVHDYKIRLLLLQYLPHYGSFITKTRLKKILLPQILLGIKDSDQELVSLTFRAIAVLIDIFGVITVLGGTNRSRYFTSGVSSENEHYYHNNIKSNNNALICERSSPDGDEANLSPLTENSGNKFILNIDNESCDNEWPDWEENKNIDDNFSQTKNEKGKTNETSTNEKQSIKEQFKTFDIKEIDFKEANYSKEIDNLFMDMAPVLNFNHKINSVDASNNNEIEDKSANKIKTDYNNISKSNIKFEVQNELTIQDIEDSGWNDSLDWNDVNTTANNTTTETMDNITASINID